MREDRKKLIWFGVIVFWICVLLIINQEKLNLFFSNTFVIQEENPEPLTYADEMPIDGITVGREIIQPLTFDRRVGHIGIKIGTYERENHSTYEISLVDQWGNVLGIAKEDTLNMKNNEYYYIKIERLITPGQEYYLKIITDSADEENAITCYASKSITTQRNVVINGVEQDYSLIMTFMYGKVKEYTNGIVAVLLFSFLIYVIYQLINGKKYLFILKSIILSKQIHQIVIVVLFICFLVAVFCKEMVYQILYTEGYHSNIYVSEALLDDVVVEQSFIYPEEKMDCIEVKFALFLQNFQSGVIHFELYECENPEIIRSSSINASDITTENISFLFPKIEDAKGKEYILKIYTTEVNSENAMSIFYTSDSSSEQTFKIHGDIVQGNILLTAGITQRGYNWKYIIIFGLIEIGIILFYLYRFHIIKRSLVILIGMLFMIGIGGVGFKVYSLYYELSIDGIIKVFIEDNFVEEKIYTQENNLYEESFSRSTRANGSCYGMIQMLELHDINTRVNIIQIKLDKHMEKRGYYISVFFDTGNGYNDNEKYSIFYTYQGEDEILLHIPYRDIVRSMRIDIGKEIHMGGIEWNEKIINVDKIVLNNVLFERINHSILFISIIIVSILCVYLFIKNKKTENIVLTPFIMIGIVYGIILSILIPIAQVPDEDYHVQHTFCAVGGDEIYEQIREINKEVGVYQIPGASGEKVNILKYKKLLTTHLDLYELNNIIEIDTLEILKRPGQTFGILIAILFKMPVFWIYFFGEVGGLLVYIGICCYTLKLLPNKKELMYMLIFLPMSLQQGGSFSYDSFNNALSFFLIVYIIYLNIEKKSVTLKDILILISIGMLLFYIKTIYAGLLLLFAIVPMDKYDIKIGKYRIDKQWIKENKKKVIVGVCIGGLLLVSIVLILKYEYVILLFQTITNIGEIFRLIFHTFIEQGTMYISTMVANFGWADTPVNQGFIVIYVFTIIFLCWFGNENIKTDNIKYEVNKKFRIIKRIIIILTVIMMVSVIMFSMLDWSFYIQAINSLTPFNNKIKLLNGINGVQGRYFIPILPMLLFISPKNKCIIKSQKKIMICMLTQFISIIYVVYILIFRYWI